MTTSSRIERDSMGELKVPSDALWGATTQRAVANFPINPAAAIPFLLDISPAAGTLQYVVVKEAIA